MYLGRIVEIGPTRGVLTAPLYPYTRALFDVVPEGGATSERFWRASHPTRRGSRAAADSIHDARF
jgi:ABC-type oligopeptide transport system ATPase subunit